MGIGKTALRTFFAGAWLAACQVAVADATVRVYAAGSLKAAFSELAATFRTREGVAVRFEFGPSGLLRDRLLGGEAADIFASANMEHPQALNAKGIAAPARPFTRNSLCALASPRLTVSPETVLERMLDPAVKLGISTPKADPSGDYALALFALADQRAAGAGERLTRKALRLTGGPDSPTPPPDRSLYGKLVEEGAADIFLTYCTNARIAHREAPGQQVVAIPPELSVGADYGLTVLNNASDDARRFAAFVLSAEGQAILGRYGFSSADVR